MGERWRRPVRACGVQTTVSPGSAREEFREGACPGADVEAHRRFYSGHESALPKAALFDPEPTLGLPPKATAATGSSVLPNQGVRRQIAFKWSGRRTFGPTRFRP